MAAHAGRPPELADILRAFAPPLHTLGRDRRRAVRDITSCRTAVLGGHLQQCDHCGREVPLYNSCRNRHCPKCQSLQQARWVEAQARDLLPIPYFHVVFTVPACLIPLFLRDRRQSYAALFAAALEALRDVCQRRLGATPGAVAVLHTWSQTLVFHPHIHCIVTGGGMSLDGTRWISSRPGFLVPVRVLSKVFRAKLLGRFEKAWARPPQLSLARPLLRQAAAQPWVVYSKAPMAGPHQVLRYLGRYTHRIAIGNERIVSITDGCVTFGYRDRRRGSRRSLLTLSGDEFARRFLLHVLPYRFVRVRHYGLLANARRTTLVTRVRALLHAPAPAPPSSTAPEREPWQDLCRRLTGRDPNLCPHCGRGTLRILVLLPPHSPTSLRGP